MTTNPPSLSPAIRIITVASVCAVAFIAAVVSYSHMQQLAWTVGEDWRSWLIPLSIDGLVVASSMTLLTRHRAGMKGGQLPWGALGGGVIASLAANMADARPEVIPVLLAGWAPVAFAIGFELLLMQRRAERLTTETPGSQKTPQPGGILPPPPGPRADPTPTFSSPPVVEVAPIPLPPIARPVPSVVQPAPVVAPQAAPVAREASLSPSPRTVRTQVPPRKRRGNVPPARYVSKRNAPDRKAEANRFFDADPGMPNRVIAEKLGVTTRCVLNYRHEWQAMRELDPIDSHTNGRVPV